MLEYFKNKKILLVVAHPDDEVLGPGATLHRLIHEFNARVRVVILGEGITSRSESRDPSKWDDELKMHRKNIDDARSEIGYESVGFYDFPDNRFDGSNLLDIIKVVEAEKKAFDPDAVFTHHGGDVNIDHQRTFEAVVTACRPLAGERVKSIVTFPTASGTEWRAITDPRQFLPNWYVTISEEDLATKIRAMECYVYERRAFPHPRSPEALRIFAAHNGLVTGVPLAECFCIVRCIQ